MPKLFCVKREMAILFRVKRALGARDIVPVICFIVLSKGSEPFLSDVERADPKGQKRKDQQQVQKLNLLLILPFYCLYIRILFLRSQIGCFAGHWHTLSCTNPLTTIVLIGL